MRVERERQDLEEKRRDAEREALELQVRNIIHFYCQTKHGLIAKFCTRWRRKDQIATRDGRETQCNQRNGRTRTTKGRGAKEMAIRGEL